MISQGEFIETYILDDEEDYYYDDKWLHIYNLGGLKEIKIEDLPSGIKFTKWCYTSIVLENIEKIPPNVIFNNRGWIEIPYVKEISENVVFNNAGYLQLTRIGKVHPTVEFINLGDIFYDGYNIPKEIYFNNDGDVYIHKDVKKISKGVVFDNNDKYISENKV